MQFYETVFFNLIQVCGIKYKPLQLLLYYFHNGCAYKINIWRKPAHCADF